MGEIRGRSLVAGDAEGVAIRLAEPLSFWGGFDPGAGRIVGRHPRSGESLAGRALVMPSGRGSSSSSSVLAEAISLGTSPVAIVMAEVDEIVAVGALVAAELYDITCPVVVVSAEDLDSIPDGMSIRVDRDGTVTF